jgi:hypothetical protein
MDELQQAVAKLRTLSPKLNSAVEQAQRVVLQVEHFLAHECQLAVQADVPVAYNDKGIAVTLLRYGRVNGKFHIALTHTDGDARFASRAWVDCDRNEKLASFPALPRLLLAVTKAVESQINSTSATTHTVSSLMSALDGSGIPIEESPVDGTKLELLMKPEEALAAQIGTRPAPRQQHALPKANPDHNTRRTPRKDEAQVG